MTMWLSKINWTRDQCRVTIPKALVKKYALDYTSHITFDDSEKDCLKIRRFLYDQKSGSAVEVDRDGED